MSVLLFIVVMASAFIIVRIGAIAFHLTGLEWPLAKFQSLSCFSGTGFTTKESELVTGHPQRRRIASALIILGNAGFITMVASVASAFTTQHAIWAKLTEIFLNYSVPPNLVRYINLGIMILAVIVVFKLSANEKLAIKLTLFLKKRVSKHFKLKHVSFEELVMLSGGYSIFKIEASLCKDLAGKTLAESGLREKGVTVMAIMRNQETMSNPPAGTEILEGDELVSFGRKDDVLKNYS